MLESKVIANTLGTIGTFLWCVQLVPQIWHNYRKKDTDGLPSAMLLIWAASSIPFGAYSFIQDFALSLQAQPQIFAALSLITWGQILYYDRERSFLAVLIAVTGAFTIIVGGEILLVYSSELIYQTGITWHTTVIAVVAGILFVLGFLPALIEIWKRRGRVAGISFGFLLIDSSGASFSLAALAFHGAFDFQGAALYLLIVIIEFAIASSHVIWLWRTRALHAKAKELGITFDELPEASQYQRHGDKVATNDNREPLLGRRRSSRYGSFISTSNVNLESSSQSE